jgi:hypothetical protein
VASTAASRRATTANTQNTCTLQEWHDLVRKTGFNVFESQGNQRSIMQMTTMAVLNRKIDDLIITQLNTGTVAIGAAGTIPNVSLFQNGRVKLSNASVPWDSNMTLLCQPSFIAYLEQATEFANAQYVDVRPYAGSDNASWKDKPHGLPLAQLPDRGAPEPAGQGHHSPRSRSCTTRPRSATRWTRAACRPRSATTRSRTTAGPVPRPTWARCCCRTPACRDHPRRQRAVLNGETSMSYFGTTQLSSVANPPRLLVSPFATNPALAGSTEFLSTQGSTAANNPNGPGGGGGGVWFYSSTNLTTDLTATNFFSDGFYIGMRAGDMVMGNSFSSLGSSVQSWWGSIVSVSTAGASLSTGSLVTSTFN